MFRQTCLTDCAMIVTCYALVCVAGFGYFATKKR
jgi:hypothetical protein